MVIEDSEAINGVTNHHDVVRAYHEASINDDNNEWSYGGDFSSLGDGAFTYSSGEITFSISASIPPDVEPNELSIVVVHETIGELEAHSTLGALRLEIGDDSEHSLISISVPLAIMMILSALSFKDRSRK